MPRAEHGFRRAAVWRAELLRCKASHGVEAMHRSAALLGFTAPELEPEEEPLIEETAPKAPARGEGRAPPPAPSRAAPTRQRYVRLLRSDKIPESERVTQAPARLALTPVLDPARIGPDLDYRPPAPPPLTPWRRLWPFLRLALGTRRFSHRVDLPRLVRRLARGEPLHRLPRLPREGWAPAAQLLVDLDLRLYPFWQDFQDLVEGLTRLRGRAGLEVICLNQGPDGEAYPWPARHQESAAPYRPPEPDTPLLILSDLGYLDGRQAPWLALGRRLKAAGVRPVALMPCPPRYWDGELAELYYPVVWDRGSHFPRYLGRVPLQGHASRPDPTPLLRLIAYAVRVEPELLRALRMRLPAAAADVGSEAEIWRHPDVRNDGLTCVLRPQAQEPWRDAAARDTDPALLVEAAELLRAHHRGLSPAIAAEEEMIRAQSTDDNPDSTTLEFMWQVAATLDRPAGYPHLQRLHSWVLRMKERQHQALWRWKQAEPMAIALAKVLVQQFGDQGVGELPKGFDPKRVLWVLQQAKPAEYELRLKVNGQGERCLLLESLAPQIARLPKELKVHQVPDQAPTGPPMVASLTDSRQKSREFSHPSDWLSKREEMAGKRRMVVASLSAPYSSVGFFAPGDILVARMTLGGDWLQWRHLDKTGNPGPVEFLDICRGQEIPLPESGRLQINGTHQRLEIDAMVCPDWAWITQGRDADGGELFHVTPRDRPDQRLRWLPAGDYPLRDLKGQPLGEYRVQAGCFMDKDQHQEIADQGFLQPDWADAIGTDAYGLYADFSYKGVAQRFRWINPGRFWMGSPEGELGRDRDEKLHEVILTYGFWLMDTVCTQRLWSTVMGENPSRLKGDSRPVERVSWVDVARFLGQLNQEVLGMELRLPTEAEWEFACRAGTETPFSFGDNVTPEQVNYHGNFPYASGKRGLYRKSTVGVKELPINTWGLYQMHGNIWEWCQDWFADYPSGTSTDPAGPAAGDRRVLRGGSWANGARRCRSAFRLRGEPGDRGSNAGFRLARGRAEGRKEKPGE